MPAPASVTPADVRLFANLPTEVPEDVLTRHIGIATRDLIRAAGVTDAPAGLEETWTEAIITRALESVFPWLNTFALDGASKVGRLEGSVEYRFLDSDDVDAKCDKLAARFEELVSVLTAPEEAEDETAQAHMDGVWMTAI